MREDYWGNLFLMILVGAGMFGIIGIISLCLSSFFFPSPKANPQPSPIASLKDERYILTINISKQLGEALNLRAEQTEGSIEEFFRRAIALFFVALDAEEFGRDLAIITKNGEVLT